MVKYEPLISILIPCYNNQQFIYELLDSIFAQTYHNLEVLIGDDGSEDFRVEPLIHWLAMHKPEWFGRISIYRNETNLGKVANIEDLQKRSSGEYLLNIAADDVLYDHTVMQCFVDKVCEIQKQGQDAEVVLAQVEMWDHELVRKKRDFLTPSMIKMIREGSSKEIFAQESVECFLPAQYLYRRSVLAKIGKLSGQYRLVEGWPAMLRLVRQGVSLHYMDKTPGIKHRDSQVSYGNTKQSEKVFIECIKDSIECYYSEVHPFEEMLDDVQQEKARRNAIDRTNELLERIRNAATQYDLEKDIQMKEETRTRKQKIKDILKKTADLKCMYRMMVLALLSYIASGAMHSEMIKIYALFQVFLTLLGCMFSGVALFGAVVKTWQIFKYRLNIFK